MKDFIFKHNVDGKHKVIEIDADMMEQGILKVLRTVATFDYWHEAMVCTKALNEDGRGIRCEDHKEQVAALRAAVKHHSTRATELERERDHLREELDQDDDDPMSYAEGLEF